MPVELIDQNNSFKRRVVFFNFNFRTKATTATTDTTNTTADTTSQEAARLKTIFAKHFE